MNQRIAFLVLTTIGLLTAVPILAQTNHTVRVRNNFFDPAELTIQAGDSVTWMNEGINHNVDADDGSFRCANGCDGEGGDGDPASNSWSFTRTFNDPGDVPYHCDVHGFPGGGMAGTVIVEGGGGGGDQPGTLRFTTNSLNAQEDAGSRTLTVERVNGDDGAVSVDFQTADGSATAGQDYQQTSGTLSWADNDDNPKGFQVPIIDDGDVEGDESFQASLSNASGGANIGQPNTLTVVIRDNDQDSTPPPSGEPGTLEFAMDVFEVNENGMAMVQVERSGGASGQVSATVTAVGFTATEGQDFQAGDQVVTFDDGESGTKPVMVPLIDDSEDEGVEIADLTLGMPMGGADLGDRTEADLAILDDDGAEGCTSGPQTLCLEQDGRFKVQASWRNQQGETGRGDVFDLPLNQSGLFTFFDENNVEILVKVLNTCSFSDRIWVFFAGTTNQGFTLTVTDTERDAIQYYSNPLGQTAETVLDVQAFQTCP